MKFTAVLLICLFAVSSADIQFSRTVDTVAPGFEGSATLSTGCTSHDQYGSNDCTLNWGEKLTIDVNATLSHDIVKGTTFSVDAKVDGILPLKVSTSWHLQIKKIGNKTNQTNPEIYYIYIYLFNVLL